MDIKQTLETAMALHQQGDIAKASELYQEVLKTDLQNADALHGLGLINAELGDYPSAVNYLTQAVNIAPHIPAFHNNLGNAYKAIKNFEKAKHHYFEALKLKTPYPEAHNNLGTLYYTQGLIDDAIYHLEKSIRLQPHRVDTHYNLANCYIQKDRLQDAATHYKKVLKQRPDHIGALHNLGIILTVLKDFEQAKPLLEQVVARQPDNIDAIFHLAIINATNNELEIAKKLYNQVLLLNPNHGDTHHNLATLYLHDNNKPKALEHYQQALAINPNNTTAKHMIDALTGKTLPEGAPLEYVRALFDQYAYNYSEHVTEKLNYQTPKLLREAIAPYHKIEKAPWDILDIGCGSGLCAPYFRDVAGKLHGVDISPNMIEVAQQLKGYDKLVVGDLKTYLKQHLKSYDVIIAADVFVYFAELETVFNLIAKSLRDDGYFCFSIELNQIPSDYHLNASGRYAHSEAYIKKVAKSHFNIVYQQQKTIREQEGQAVPGLIYLLQKT